MSSLKDGEVWWGVSHLGWAVVGEGRQLGVEVEVESGRGDIEADEQLCLF